MMRWLWTGTPRLNFLICRMVKIMGPTSHRLHVLPRCQISPPSLFFHAKHFLINCEEYIQHASSMCIVTHGAGRAHGRGFIPDNEWGVGRWTGCDSHYFLTNGSAWDVSGESRITLVHKWLQQKSLLRYILLDFWHLKENDHKNGFHMSQSFNTFQYSRKK